MAKKRTKITSDSAKEALEMTSDLVQDKTTKKTTSKEEAKRFNLRIPRPLADRLEAVVGKTGLSQTAIILGGLNEELHRLEKK